MTNPTASVRGFRACLGATTHTKTVTCTRCLRALPLDRFAGRYANKVTGVCLSCRTLNRAAPEVAPPYDGTCVIRTCRRPNLDGETLCANHLAAYHPATCSICGGELSTYERCSTGTCRACIRRYCSGEVPAPKKNGVWRGSARA